MDFSRTICRHSLRNLRLIPISRAVKKESPETPKHAESQLFEFNLLQLANYLYSNRWWIAIGTAICILLTVFWVSVIKRPNYRASVTINIDLFSDEKGSTNLMASPFFMQDQMVANKVGIVEQYFDSEEFKIYLYNLITKEDPPAKLSDEIGLVLEELKKKKLTARDEINEWLHSQLDLKGLSEKSRIEFTANASRPPLAAALANIGAYGLIEYNREMLVQRLKNLKGFLNTQTLKAKNELRKLEVDLVNLQKKAKIVSPDEIRAKVNALQVEQEAKLIEFGRQYAAFNTLIAETESDLSFFKKLMQENKPSSYLYIEQIQRRLEVLRYEKAQKANDDPAIDQGISKVISELSQQLQSLGPVSQTPWEYVKKIETALFDLKQKRQAAHSELLAQQAAVQRTNKQFIGLPDVLKEMSEVKRNIDLTTSLYTALMTRLQDSQIKEAAHSNDLIMVSSAEPPTAPSGLGKTKSVLISIFVGFLLSCLPFFLRFVLLPTIRNVKDLAHMHVPIIGAVGWYRGKSAVSLPFQFSDRQPRLLIEASNSPEANALRLVRFQVEQGLQLRAYQTGKGSRILQVSSVNPKEGRSFVAANLAELFAAAGFRTILIDLDFANPCSSRFFTNARVENSPMVDLFPSECTMEMLRVNEKLNILRPMIAQNDNMSEILETRQFESGLKALEVVYELVIIDTPPVTGHMEPVITAQYADAILFVINQRRTLRNEVEEAIRTLQSSLKIPIYGVMNFVFDDLANARRKQKKTGRSMRQFRPTQRPPSEAA